MEKTTVYLPPEMKRGIERRARRDGQSGAHVIREAISLYLANDPVTPIIPKSIGIVSSGRVQSDRVDEWLENNWESASPTLPSLFGSEASDGTVTSENHEDWLTENWKPDW